MGTDVPRWSDDAPCHMAIGEFFDPVGASPKTLDVERDPANPARVVILKRVERIGRDVADVLSLEDRAFPGVVAVGAAIDQPGIQPPAVGVQPRLAAAFEWARAAAAAAGEPGARRGLWFNGPQDRQCVRHVVWFFQ